LTSDLTSVGYSQILVLTNPGYKEQVWLAHSVCYNRVRLYSY